MTLLAEYNNQVTTLKVRVTLKGLLLKHIFLWQLYHLLTIQKLLGTNDPHRDTSAEIIIQVATSKVKFICSP
jgi:hypothetical protein